MDIDAGQASPETVSRLLKQIVAPRPIGWISTVSSAGALNLAPYSFFNAVEDTPPILMFASGGLKDSARNCMETGEFVANLVTLPLADAMNTSARAVPHGVSEFDIAGLATAPSRLVKPPRVAAAAAALECRVIETRQLRDLAGGLLDTFMILGQVVFLHVDERILAGDRVNYAAEPVLSRLGGSLYAAVSETLSLKRP